MDDLRVNKLTNQCRPGDGDTVVIFCESGKVIAGVCRYNKSIVDVEHSTNRKTQIGVMIRGIFTTTENSIAWINLTDVCNNIKDAKYD